ncbi:penicillin-binding protein 2B [Verrucomicrobiota bacterium]|nr:penicillin-binding protein 2B [Verrucomicrobiota bacterium]
MKALNIKALRAELKYRRSYPKNALAAHVLGFVNKEGEPASGIERVMHSLLSGQKGWIESERDGKHREIASIRIREVAPVDGSNVVLTLNSLVQKTCEDALAAAAARYNPKGGIIIVSEPRTGRILGLANWPTFDLNLFWTRRPRRWIASVTGRSPTSTSRVPCSRSSLSPGRSRSI